MPRRKLTDEEKAERDAKIEAERNESNLQSQLEDIRENKKKWLHKDPTYKFNVGDKVTFGHHPNAVIEEVLDDSTIYKIRCFGKKKVYTETVDYEVRFYVAWTRVRPFRTIKEDKKHPIISRRDDIHIQFTQQGISSLFTIVYGEGIDIEPDYQRGNVWGQDQQLALIDSIFDNVEIGKFVIITNREANYYYEMLDGKQRLNTLVDFYENRFHWKGKYFNELSWRDQGHFENYSISVGYVDNMTQKQKYEYFLKLNTGGKPVSKKHLDKVRKLYNEEK